MEERNVCNTNFEKSCELVEVEIVLEFCFDFDNTSRWELFLTSIDFVLTLTVCRHFISSPSLTFVNLDLRRSDLEDCSYSVNIITTCHFGKLKQIRPQW